MAQLREDEWPTDGEPTTSEQEGDRVKGDNANAHGNKAGHPAGASDRPNTGDDKVEPDRSGD